MSKEIIVFISEGEKTEKQVVKNLEKVFFNKNFNNKDIILLPFKADIYQLYNKLKEDDFETDIIELLIERDPSVETEITSNGRDKQSISQIYLFFDYDGQAHNGSDGDDIVKEMVDFFSNETDFGKIYISYPMVEALKDLKKVDDCSRRCSVLAKQNIHYKCLVGDDTEFGDLTNLKDGDWYYILNNSIKKANCIVSSSFSVPTYNEYQSNINQISILENQIRKFINVDGTIAVLGGFPLFIIDYFGESIFVKAIDKEKQVNNQIKKGKCSR